MPKQQLLKKTYKLVGNAANIAEGQWQEFLFFYMNWKKRAQNCNKNVSKIHKISNNNLSKIKMYLKCNKTNFKIVTKM